MKHIALTALLLVVAPMSFAQMGKEQAPATANPIVTTVRQMEQRYAKNLTGAARGDACRQVQLQAHAGADQLRAPDDARGAVQQRLDVPVLPARSRRDEAERN